MDCLVFWSLTNATYRFKFTLNCKKNFGKTLSLNISAGLSKTHPIPKP